MREGIALPLIEFELINVEGEREIGNYLEANTTETHGWMLTKSVGINLWEPEFPSFQSISPKMLTKEKDSNFIV